MFFAKKKSFLTLIVALFVGSALGSATVGSLTVATSLNDLPTGTKVGLVEIGSNCYVGTPSIEHIGGESPDSSTWYSVATPAPAEISQLPATAQFTVINNGNGTVSFKGSNGNNMETVTGVAGLPNPAFCVDSANMFPANQNWNITFSSSVPTTAYINNIAWSATSGCLKNSGSGILRTGYPAPANPGDPGTAFQIVLINGAISTPVASVTVAVPSSSSSVTPSALPSSGGVSFAMCYDGSLLNVQPNGTIFSSSQTTGLPSNTWYAIPDGLNDDCVYLQNAAGYLYSMSGGALGVTPSQASASKYQIMANGTVVNNLTTISSSTVVSIFEYTNGCSLQWHYNTMGNNQITADLSGPANISTAQFVIRQVQGTEAVAPVTQVVTPVVPTPISPVVTPVVTPVATPEATPEVITAPAISTVVTTPTTEKAAKAAKATKAAKAAKRPEKKAKAKAAK